MEIPSPINAKGWRCHLCEWHNRSDSHSLMDITDLKRHAITRHHIEEQQWLSFFSKAIFEIRKLSPRYQPDPDNPNDLKSLPLSLGLQTPIVDFQSSNELKEGTLKMDYLLRDIKGIPAFKHVNEAPEILSRGKQHAHPTPRITRNEDFGKGNIPPVPSFSGNGNSKWVSDIFPRESLGGRTVDQLSPILGASRQLAGFSMDAFDEELGAMGFGKQSRVDTFSICTSVPTPPIPEADPSEARELLDYYDEIREAGGYQETF